MKAFNIVLLAVCLLTPKIAWSQISDWANFSNSNSYWNVATNWNPMVAPDSKTFAQFHFGNTYEVWWGNTTGNTNCLVMLFENGTVCLLNQDATPFVHTTGRIGASNLANVTVKGIHLHTNQFNNNLFTQCTVTIDGNHPAGTMLTTDGFWTITSAVYNVQNGANAFHESLVVAENGNVIVSGADSTIVVQDSLVTDDIQGAGNPRIDISDQATFTVLGSLNVAGEMAFNISGGGHFDFGTAEHDELSGLTGSDGSVAGNVLNSDTIQTSSFTGLQGIQLDTSNLFLINNGLLLGSATLDCSLCNTGEVRLLEGERLVFTARNGGVTNEGEINNLNGTFEAHGSVENCGFIAGRGVFASDDGFFNESVVSFVGTADVFGDVFNNGQIVNTGGETTTFYDDVDNNGSEIRTSFSTNTIILGAATGAGSYTGPGTVFFEGDLQPGNSPAEVNFEGNLVLGSSAITEIEIGGTNIGEFDRLLVEGNFAAGGILFANTIDGFELVNGMQFQIVDVGSGSFGQFFGLSEGTTVATLNGVDLNISYVGGDGNDIVLSTPNVPLLGDVNLDGVVNLLDVQPFVQRISTGSFQAEADTNLDDVVNLLDVSPFIAILAGK